MITILALEVLLGPLSDLVSEFYVVIDKINLLQDAIDYLAKIQTEVDVLVICIDLFSLLNHLSCLFRLPNIF